MVLQPLFSARLATLSLAVSALLFAPIVNAAVIGDTAIYSKLHEPLSASIEVSDIDPDSFTVSVANKVLYQQMGMSTSVPVTVTFEKTSDSTGVLILSSPRPVSEPFADVVLVVNDQGRAQSLPKTLLLPLGRTVKPNATRQTIVGTSPKPKLPTVTFVEEPINATIFTEEPDSTVTLAEELLFQVTSDSPTASNSNEIAATPSFPSKQDFFKTDTQSQTSQVASVAPITDAANSLFEPIDSMDKSDTNMLVQSGADKQTAILSTQITRKYSKIEDNAQSAELGTVPKVEQQIAAASLNPKETTTSTPQHEATNKDSTSTATNVSVPSPSNNSSAQTASSNPKLPLGKATYKVQRNDNLWTIAQQIADKNNMTVFEVMDQIQAYNPNAFINGQKSQLLANAELSLPDYEVIPSKLGMRAALQARNQTRTSTKATAKSQTTTQTKPNTKAMASRPKSSSTKPLPKPRLTLVTPTKQGQATGIARTGSKQNINLNASLVASLETARKKAAAQAQLVRGINNDLSARARKLQLYNQKLAALEKRLKELRDQ